MMLPVALALALAASLCAPAGAQDTPPLKPPAIEPVPKSGDRATKDAAIVIGNEAYDALPQATFARADARSWAAWLEDTRGVRSSRIYTLHDASKKNIWREVRRRVWKTRRGGTMWVIFAGQGAMTAAKDGQRALLGSDANPDTIGQDGLSLQDIAHQLLRNRRTARVVFILDTSFDGRGRDGLEIVPGTNFLVPDTVPIADDRRVVVWSAAPGSDPVTAWIGAGHSAFTWAAQGALRGWADGAIDGQQDGTVTLAEADAYTAWTRRQLGIPARPGLVGLDEDLPLSQGPWLEAGPSDDTLSAFSSARRQQAFDSAETLLRAEAAAFWQHTLEQARQGGDQGKQELQAFIDAFGSKEVAISWPVALPEVREARHLLARYDDLGQGDEAVAEVAAVAQVVADESCDDLVTLEPQAMLGQLSAGQVGCLDRRVRTDRLQTDREKASRVLIVNALAAGDQSGWSSLVERHLDQISRADPNLIMQYVVWLFRTDPVGRGEDAIHWADIALENKQRWEGATFVKNVGALLQIRAETAYKLWMNADKLYRSSHDDESEFEAEENRGLTKDYSREWLDYLRAAGQNSDKAMQICTSAAGTTDFCRAR
ncbi:MAG: caspase family protein [Oligoflexia bacterium]|nr:caspase family protein [Oligoflexia bacterium]